jgi:hypothetical protein
MLAWALPSDNARTIGSENVGGRVSVTLSWGYGMDLIYATG